MVKKELLSPAGDFDTLYAAINGGCDAVYLGVKDYGARKFAHNFTNEEIEEAVKVCHLYGVRLYVTLNTVIKDHEVTSFLEEVDFLYTIGVDAFIMQDFGMINLVLAMYPEMEIHASTQFNNSCLKTIQLLKDLGVKRVVLARELTLEECERVSKKIEVEVFIHGALCISYSGNCLFSSMLGNRSGNRGECTGCCRLFYELYQKNQFIRSGYLLSTKELNTSSKFDDLLNSSIKSFKIEGRMKSAEYVYFVTKFYRNIIDGKGYTLEDENLLKILYNREFTEGHLFSKPIMNIKSPNHVGLKIGKVIEVNKDKIKIKLERVLRQEDGIRFAKSKRGMTVNFLYDEKGKLTNECQDICFVKNQVDLKEKDDVYLTSSKYLSREILKVEKRKVPIKMKFIGKIGEKICLKVDDGLHEVCVDGCIGIEAVRRSITKDEINEKLNKLGDSVYTLSLLEVEIANNLFIPIKELNDLRRRAIELLNIKRCEVKRNRKKKICFEQLDIPVLNYDTIVVSSEEELKLCLDYGRIYTDNYTLFLKYKDKLNIYYKEKRNQFDGKVEVQRLVGEYSYSNQSISDYSFNVTNIYSVYYLLKLGYSCVTLSYELTSEECDSLIDCFYQKFKFYPNVEVMALDKCELMLIKGNILNITSADGYYLLDTKKRKYDVYFDGEFTHVLDYKLTCRDIHYGCKRYNFKYLK